MSRKYNSQDKALFKAVFLQFAWIPPSQLAAMMQVLAQAGSLPDKWADFNPATAFRWVQQGKWRDQVDALKLLVEDDTPLPSDDAIDDRLMRRNLQLLDLLSARILGEIGDPQHAMKSYLVLQAQIRTHVQLRQAIPLTPTQLIELFVRAGYYAAGQAFDAQKAKEFLIQAFSHARQLAPAGMAA